MKSHIQALVDKPQHDASGHKKKASVFSALLESKLPAYEKTVKRLKGEGQTLIGAGTLTTANVLKTVVYHTLVDPKRLRALILELETEFPTDSHTDEELPTPFTLRRLEKLPLLTAYITEALRLAYGVTHRLQLLSDEPLCAAGRVIPPRTPVGMTSIFMHDDPDVFPEPRAFRPERWLPQPGEPAEERLRRNRHFVPFSKGTRMCLGMHLAWAEIYMVLATLLRSYSFSLFETAREDIEMAHDFFDPSPKLDSRGLRVVVKKR